VDFEKRGGLKLTESAHIKDVVSYLRVIANPQDHLSWNRILLQLNKVGPKTAQAVLERVKAAENPLDALKKYPAGKSWREGLAELVTMLSSLQEQGQSPSEQFEVVMDYYWPVFERIYHDDYPRRSRDLDQLKVLLAGYDSLQAFLDDVSLDPPGSAVDASGLASGMERLVLSTVHSAKGLEWDTVFVINLAEGKFPSAQASSPEEFEEERRLMYVAATRAKKRLFFVYPREVISPERMFSLSTISPFLDEIPPQLVSSASQGNDWLSAATAGKERASGYSKAAGSALPRKQNSSPGPDEMQEMREGCRVKHSFFGEGRIVKVAGPRTVDVFFSRHGIKTLHLDYARLEFLS